MIIYNPKNWFALIFQFRKADTARRLAPAILAIAAYTAVVTWIDEHYLHAPLLNTTSIHSLVGIVISLVLVFRTNSAYDRWWEGRKLWGQLVNTSRTLAMSWHARVEDEQSRRRVRVLLAAFPYSLKEHLRNSRDLGPESRDVQEIIGAESIHAHLPNALVSALTEEVYTARQRGLIDGYDAILFQPMLTMLSDINGACERIKNTPIPYSYNIFIKKVIFIFSLTFPFAVVASFSYWSVPITVFVFYALASLEMIAEEVEDPFGTDENDLPTEVLSDRIRANVHTLFRQQ